MLLERPLKARQRQLRLDAAVSDERSAAACRSLTASTCADSSLRSASRSARSDDAALPLRVGESAPPPPPPPVLTVWSYSVAADADDAAAAARAAT